jgi:hypothetical protein
LHFFRHTFGKNFTLELNGDESHLLMSILEFVHRESQEKGSWKGRISPEEIEFAKRVSDEIEPYIEEFEYKLNTKKG